MSKIVSGTNVFKYRAPLSESWIPFNGRFSPVQENVMGHHDSKIDQYPGKKTEGFLVLRTRIPWDVKISTSFFIETELKDQDCLSPLTVLVIGSQIVDFFEGGKVVISNWHEDLSWDVIKMGKGPYSSLKSKLEVTVQRSGETLKVMDAKKALILSANIHRSKSNHGNDEVFAIGNRCSRAIFSPVTIATD